MTSRARLGAAPGDDGRRTHIALDWLAERLELSRGGAAANVRPMEGLRGLAVFLVFLVHYVTLVKPWLADSPALALVAARLHAMGNVGVDLFFLLSGYLIYGSLLARPQPFRRFMGRRITRIYPAFLAVFALYLLLSWVFPAESKIPTGLTAASVYLLQNLLLLPGLLPIEPMITVAWSLSYEMFYYLVVPLAVGALGLRRGSRRARVVGIVLLGVALALLFAVCGGPVRLLMFVFGILLFEIHSGDVGPRPGSILGLVALLAALATAWLEGGPGVQALRVAGIGACFFMLCLAVFQTTSGWLARGLAWAPLRWLGNMSYSYYLLHGLALKAAFKLLAIVLVPSSGGWVFWLALPLMFGVTLLPSLMLFLWVERPYSLQGAPPGGPVVSRKPVLS